VNSMKPLVRSLCLSSLFVVNALAQEPMKLVEVGHDHFEAAFPSGGQIRMHIRPGAIKIIGSDEKKIQVHYSGKNADQSKHVKVSLKTSGDVGELNISGGPRNNFEIEVEVPKSCNLYLRITAGEVEVAGITGNKDVELSFGDLTVEVSKAEDYAHVDASVYSGDLDAEPFAVSKGGLFRSFQKQGPGKYRLHAHVGAGELMLKPAVDLRLNEGAGGNERVILIEQSCQQLSRSVNLGCFLLFHLRPSLFSSRSDIG
jgi:hypothetical protein